VSDKIQLRIHGSPSAPTLVYLPGLHGNWTLVGSFRRALAERVRFVETTYPNTLSWSLDDHAAAVETALAEQGITQGWVLGESFSSQVVWPLLARNPGSAGVSPASPSVRPSPGFHIQGIVLAGGFVRHPMRWAVRRVERLCGEASLGLITRILFGYARVARWRFRHSPETITGIQEFISHVTEEGRQAAKHRLRLIANNDPCPIARGAQIPIYALTGSIDPVVPWFWARRWLKKNCPSLREYRIIWRADHNVLGTAPQTAADQVVKWMSAPLTHPSDSPSPTGPSPSATDSNPPHNPAR
jgi:pimeloyl-ACP methyl ester carboxylesterase